MFDVVSYRIDVNQITPAKCSGDSTAKNAIVEARHHLQGLTLDLAHAQRTQGISKVKAQCSVPNTTVLERARTLIYALININKQI